MAFGSRWIKNKGIQVVNDRISHCLQYSFTDLNVLSFLSYESISLLLHSGAPLRGRFHMDRVPIYTPTERFSKDLKPSATDLPFRGVIVVFMLLFE
ncbi:hypothetical protein VNO77_01977 [Canavalia gladiata]|uniref:Uncharacterized protein n=1 Tax=Canavalia gladiata TaxID=3824 RepID=A0AAN9R2L7_CANGL